MISSSNKGRYRDTCQLPLYRINCAYSCWRQRTYFIIYWWPLVTTSNTIHSHNFSLETVMHLKMKAKTDILSENIYFFCVGKTGKVNFPTNHILNSNIIISPCVSHERLYYLLRFILFSLQFFDIGAYTGCLTNVFIFEWKMNLSLMALNPTWTAAPGWLIL